MHVSWCVHNHVPHAPQLPERLCSLISGAATVLYDVDRDAHLHHRAGPLEEAVNDGQVRPLRPMLHHLRWMKSAGELALLRGAVGAACDAMRDVMRGSGGGRDSYQQEHEVAARFGAWWLLVCG